jgi:hypothetical protein
MGVVTGGWRKLHNGEFHNLNTSPNVMVIKSREMRWMEHAARMGHEKCMQKFSWEPEESQV